MLVRTSKDRNAVRKESVKNRVCLDGIRRDGIANESYALALTCLFVTSNMNLEPGSETRLL